MSVIKKIKSLFSSDKNELLSIEKIVAFYSSFIPKNSLVFDVGANIGNRIEPLLKITENIVAVEPQPECINFLQNKYQNSIKLEQVGLASQEGELELFLANESIL
jgi:16S rRNA A1518/A1519 N6-dimethyltransferase RsmA/KsgA/DIM1 with predicted DNA glycosylase/AP lyase activity